MTHTDDDLRSPLAGLWLALLLAVPAWLLIVAAACWVFGVV